jgi:hypothetical protein
MRHGRPSPARVALFSTRAWRVGNLEAIRGVNLIDTAAGLDPLARAKPGASPPEPPERGTPTETPERLTPSETPERITPAEPPERPDPARTEVRFARRRRRRNSQRLRHRGQADTRQNQGLSTSAKRRWQGRPALRQVLPVLAVALAANFQNRLAASGLHRERLTIS